MKKRFFLVTALVLLVLASGFADGTTWTNPDDLLTGFYPVPNSMMSSVTNGIYYDEIDTIITSPAELSNYSGWSIFTAYGNYEFDYAADAAFDPTTVVNPFVYDTIGNGETTDYKLGATGELFGFRGGVIAGFNLGETGNLAGSNSTYEYNSSETIDAGTIGTADYTYTIAEDYTDYTSENNFRLGAGVDLEFIGASLYGLFSNNIDILGGNYTYTRPLTADTTSPDAADTVTSAVITYGNNDEGKPRLEPNSSPNGWLLGARAHMPLEVADISMPVKVNLNFGNQDVGLGGALPKKTETITTSNLALGSDKTNTITAVYGFAGPATPTLSAPTSGLLADGDVTYDETAFRAVADDIKTGGYADALDPENYSEANFQTGFQAVIDPEIVVSDVLSLQTRGQLGYQFGVTSENNATMRSVVYSEAETVAENSAYSYSETVSAPTTEFENTIDIEIGGLMELHNRDNTIGVSTGLFYHPTMTFTSNISKPEVTTINESWNDASNSDAEIAAWPVYDATTLGPGIAQGTYSSTETVTYTDGKNANDTNTYVNNFYIPTATRIAFANNKLELVGGYLLKHTKTTTVTKSYTGTDTTDTVETLANSTGTPITEPAVTATAAVPTSTTTVTKAVTAPGTWAGQMSFMLRWNAMENLTVDLFGRSIMSALDFSLFGNDAGDIGFNPANVILNLGMSVTISME